MAQGLLVAITLLIVATYGARDVYYIYQSPNTALRKSNPLMQTFAAELAYFISRFLASVFFIVNVADTEGFGKVKYDVWDEDRKRQVLHSYKR